MKVMAEKAKSNKPETTEKPKQYNWVEFLINVKYGDKLFKIGDKLQVSPVQANILAKDNIARKL